MIAYLIYFHFSAIKSEKKLSQTFCPWTIQFSRDGTLVVHGRRVFLSVATFKPREECKKTLFMK